MKHVDKYDDNIPDNSTPVPRGYTTSGQDACINPLSDPSHTVAQTWVTDHDD